MPGCADLLADFLFCCVQSLISDMGTLEIILKYLVFVRVAKHQVWTAHISHKIGQVRIIFNLRLDQVLHWR
jgi:hypothetical protein